MCRGASCRVPARVGSVVGVGTLSRIRVPSAEAQQAAHDAMHPALVPGLVDAVTWTNLITSPLPSSVAGYDDGYWSTWPAAAWAFWAAHRIPAAHITCLASSRSLVFDFEQGNAPIGKVCASIKVRWLLGLPSVIYTNRALYAQAKAGLAAVGLSFAGRASWPARGVYLWAADWTGSPHDPGWADVDPISVQYESLANLDLSETWSTFPLTVPDPPPAPPRPVPPVVAPPPAPILEVIPAMPFVARNPATHAEFYVEGGTKAHIAVPGDTASIIAAIGQKGGAAEVSAATLVAWPTLNGGPAS